MFVIVTGEIPKWWIWGYWISPLTYGFNAIAVNEMFAPRWMNKKVCQPPIPWKEKENTWKRLFINILG